MEEVHFLLVSDLHEEQNIWIHLSFPWREESGEGMGRVRDDGFVLKG